MEKIDKVTGVAAPMTATGINTDQVFPARFLRKPRATGYAQFAFHDIRRDGDGNLKPDFPLNQDRYKDARMLVAGADFGIGSSREGAVYTLLDAGIRVLIAPSFGDIYAANCLKNGILTIRLDAATVERLQDQLQSAETPQLSVDLEAETLTAPDGEVIAFEVDPFQKHCLLNGLNEIDLSLEFAADIDRFETADRDQRPWLHPN